MMLTKIEVKKLRFKQNGNVSAEWAMLTFMVVMAFFAPLPGENQSIMAIVMEAIRGFYANMSLLLSLP